MLLVVFLYLVHTLKLRTRHGRAQDGSIGEGGEGRES